jgi:soluble lytic murein transglycosylase-like protein
MKENLKFYSFIALGILVLAMIVKKVTDISEEYDALFIKYANKEGLDWKMLKAISMNESSLGKNKGYEPIGGTVGLMQIKLSTASDYYDNLTSNDMYDDEIQVMTASAFLRDLLDKTGNDIKKAVMSYNQGLGNTLKGKTYASSYYEKYINNYKKLLG